MITYTRTVDGRQVQIVADPDAETIAHFAASETLFGLDVEGTAIDDTGVRFFGPATGVRLVQLATADRALVLRPSDPDQYGAIVALLSDETKRFVSHTNFDVLACWSALGVALGQRAIDTHLLASLIDPGETADHGLKALSERHIDGGLLAAEAALQEHFKDIAPAGQRVGSKLQRYGWNHVAIDAEPYVVYAGLDAIYVRILLDRLISAMAEFGELPRIEMWLAAQTTAMAIRGVRLDEAYTATLAREFQDRNAAARTRLTERMGCPATSPKRVDWLLERGVTFAYLTATGKPSMSSKDALPDLLARYPDGEVGQMLADTLEMSDTQNFANNLVKFPAFADIDGRVHPDIKTLAARTGRMSVKYPAMQTFKKTDPRLRGCFIAEEGHVLVGCDFSNVELRVAAALSGDRALTGVFLEGQDVHNNTSMLVWGDIDPAHRKLAKALNFGTCYGGGAPGLSRQAGIPIDSAREAVSRFRQAYPGITAFGRVMGERDEVRNAFRRRIPAALDPRYANSNYAIQSTARDLFVEAIYRLCVVEGYHDALWMLVHDEIVVQVPVERAEAAKAALERAMTTTFRGVPIVAEAEIIGPRWGVKASTEAPKAAGLSVAA